MEDCIFSWIVLFIISIYVFIKLAKKFGKEDSADKEKAPWVYYY